MVTYSRDTEELLSQTEDLLRRLDATPATRAVMRISSRLANWVEAAASVQIEGEQGSASDLAYLRMTARGEALPTHLQAAVNADAGTALALNDPAGCLTPEGIQRLHAVVMNGLLTPKKLGTWRTGRAWISDAEGNPVHEGFKAREIPDTMAHWSRTYAATTPGETVRRAARAHLAFETVHPFSDGNGRVGRALSAAIGALGHAPPLPLSKVLADNRTAYFKAITDAQHEGDAEPYVRFHATATGRSVWLAQDISRAITETADSLKGLDRHNRLLPLFTSRPIFNAETLAASMHPESPSSERQAIGQRLGEVFIARGILIATGPDHYGASPLLKVLREPCRLPTAITSSQQESRSTSSEKIRPPTARPR